MNMFVSSAALTAAMPTVVSANDDVGVYTNPEHVRALDQLTDDWCRASLQSRKSSKLYNEKMVERTGLRGSEGPNFGEEGFAEFQAISQQVSDEIDAKYPELASPSDEHGRDIFWTNFHNELHSLCREIAASETKTLADLGLKARALALANPEYWDDEADDARALEIRQFVDTVCRWLGIEALPPAMVVPLDQVERVAEEREARRADLEARHATRDFRAETEFLDYESWLEKIDNMTENLNLSLQLAIALLGSDKTSAITGFKGGGFGDGKLLIDCLDKGRNIGAYTQLVIGRAMARQKNVTVSLSQ